MSNENNTTAPQHTPLHTATAITDIWQEERAILGRKYAKLEVELNEAKAENDRTAPKANENIFMLLIRVAPRILAVNRLKSAQTDLSKHNLRLNKLLRARISGMADALIDPKSIEAGRRQSYHDQWADYTFKQEASNNAAYSLSQPRNETMRDSLRQHEADATHYANKAETMQILYFKQEMDIIKAAAANDNSGAAARFLFTIKGKAFNNLENITPTSLNGKPKKGLRPGDTPKPKYPPYGHVPF